MTTFRDKTINEAQRYCHRYNDGFSRDDITFYHSVDKEGRHVTIGKAEYKGTFGLGTALEKLGDINPAVVCLPNYGAGYEYIARATCHPGDEHDPEFAETLVTKRIFEKYHVDELRFLHDCAAFMYSMSCAIIERADGIQAHFGIPSGTLFPDTVDDTSSDELTTD